jgi:hypothetical protein
MNRVLSYGLEHEMSASTEVDLFYPFLTGKVEFMLPGMLHGRYQSCGAGILGSWNVVSSFIKPLPPDMP